MRGLTVDELDCLRMTLAPDTLDESTWRRWEETGIIEALQGRGLLTVEPCAGACGVSPSMPHTDHSVATTRAKLAIECHTLATSAPSV